MFKSCAELEIIIAVSLLLVVFRLSRKHQKPHVILAVNLLSRAFMA